MTYLLIPMATMVFYITAFGIFTLIMRVRGVAQGKINPKYFRNFDSSIGVPPDFYVRLGRHFDNLLQAPLLFLVTATVCLQVGLYSLTVVILAWLFVLSRALHTWIHMGRNHVIYRAASFFLGFFILLIMWIMILIHAFNS